MQVQLSPHTYMEGREKDSRNRGHILTWALIITPRSERGQKDIMIIINKH